MQVGVEVYSEDPMTGNRTHTSSALVTYVALGTLGRPSVVPRLNPETEEEKRFYREAEKRRNRLLELKK